MRNSGDVGDTLFVVHLWWGLTFILARCGFIRKTGYFLHQADYTIRENGDQMGVGHPQEKRSVSTIAEDEPTATHSANEVGLKTLSKENFLSSDHCYNAEEARKTVYISDASKYSEYLHLRYRSPWKSCLEEQNGDESTENIYTTEVTLGSKTYPTTITLERTDEDYSDDILRVQVTDHTHDCTKVLPSPKVIRSSVKPFLEHQHLEKKLDTPVAPVDTKTLGATQQNTEDTSDHSDPTSSSISGSLIELPQTVSSDSYVLVDADGVDDDTDHEVEEILETITLEDNKSILNKDHPKRGPRKLPPLPKVSDLMPVLTAGPVVVELLQCKQKLGKLQDTQTKLVVNQPSAKKRLVPDQKLIEAVECLYNDEEYLPSPPESLINMSDHDDIMFSLTETLMQYVENENIELEELGMLRNIPMNSTEPLPQKDSTTTIPSIQESDPPIIMVPNFNNGMLSKQPSDLVERLKQVTADVTVSLSVEHEHARPRTPLISDQEFEEGLRTFLEDDSCDLFDSEQACIALMNLKCQKDASPLSRFTQPQFEQRLAAKLTTMQPVSDRHEIATSPIHDEVTPSRRKPISISQSTSGDFTGSSRNSPFGEYDSNYTSETYSRSYTPSYSYTPSDQSDMSECSSPSSPDGLKRSSSAGLVRPRFVRPPVLRGGRGIRGGFRGRATGIQRVRSSHSGDQLGGLIESSSAESFMSNTSEADFMPTHKTPRLQPGYGLKRPAASHNTASPKSSLSPQPGRKQAGTKPGIKRPAETPKQVAARPGIQKPSGLQKPRGGIPKPSGIGKPRGSGIVRPGLKKPTKTLQSSWDDGCY